MCSSIHYQLSISFYYYNVQGKQGGRRTNQSQLTEGERREWWDDRRQEQLCKRTRCHIKFNTNKSITSCLTLPQSKIVEIQPQKAKYDPKLG